MRAKNFLNLKLILTVFTGIILFIAYGTLFSAESTESGSTSSNTEYASKIGKKTKIIIPILQTVEHPALNVARKGVEDELTKAGYDFEYESAQSNPALASQIAQKFIGEDPKVMVGIGTTAAEALISNNRKQGIPIVFSSVTDPVGTGLVASIKKPGGKVTGVSDYTDPAKQFAMFKRILPKLTKLGIIYNPGENNSRTLIEAMEKAAIQFNIQLVTAAANNTSEVADAALSLVSKVDAIFINNDNTALSAFDTIVRRATEHKIPVFVSDTDIVDRGALAALGPDQYTVGRQAGQLVIKILAGATPANSPVLFPEKVELFLNMKAAKALSIEIPKDVADEAAKVIQ